MSTVLTNNLYNVKEKTEKAKVDHAFHLLQHYIYIQFTVWIVHYQHKITPYQKANIIYIYIICIIFPTKHSNES